MGIVQQWQNNLKKKKKTTKDGSEDISIIKLEVKLWDH